MINSINCLRNPINNKENFNSSAIYMEVTLNHLTLRRPIFIFIAKINWILSSTAKKSGQNRTKEEKQTLALTNLFIDFISLEKYYGIFSEY
jgi:hypothetical protein